MSTKKNPDNDAFSEYGISTQEQRTKLLLWGKILVYFGWTATVIIAILTIIFVILWGTEFKWGFFGLLFGILVISQGIRIVGRMLKKKSEQLIPFSEKKISHVKTQREKEVRKYFNENEAVAAKVLQMKSLAQQGKYKDAYNMTLSLLKMDLPTPIQEFLISNKNRYAKLRKKK